MAVVGNFPHGAGDPLANSAYGGTAGAMQDYKERRRSRKLLGKCTSCGQFVEPDSTSFECKGCQKKRKTRQALRRARAKAEGKCVFCRRTAEYGRNRCEPCRVKAREYQRAYSAKRKSKGICTRCGRLNMSGKYSQCEDCSSKMEMRRAWERARAGRN